MKKIILLMSFALVTISNSFGQAFSNPDTVIGWVGANIDWYDALITNNTSGNIAIDWKIIATDFPTDWYPFISICDNHSCYANGTTNVMWNGTTGTQFHSFEYAPGGNGAFHLLNNFTTASTGTHYITVSLKDSATSYTKTTTFIIKNPTTGLAPVVKNTDDILLYPNPAINQVNVVFSENAGIKMISIHNIIGKAVSMFRVQGNSAGLNIDNLPSGVYFIRLLNSEGNVIATRKFNKQ